MLLGTCIFFLSFHSVHSVKASFEIEDRLIKKLAQIFELKGKWREGVGAGPGVAVPEYMADLFSNVAYTDGISKSAPPYNADVIRGFVNKKSLHYQSLFFEVSQLKLNEEVMEAELHLFQTSDAKVYIYQVMKESNPNFLKLLHIRDCFNRTHGWQVFDLKTTVHEWITNPKSNFGLIIKAVNSNNEILSDDKLPFILKDENKLKSKSPVLLIFSQLKTEDFNEILDDSAYEPPMPASSDLKQMRLSYIQFLNEAYRTKLLKKSPSIRRRRHFMSPQVHQQLVISNFENQMKALKSRTNIRKRREVKSSERLTFSYNTSFSISENIHRTKSNNVHLNNTYTVNIDDTNRLSQLLLQTSLKGNSPHSPYFNTSITNNSYDYTDSNRYLNLDVKNEKSKRRSSIRRKRAPNRRRKMSCQRHDMYVDFDKIGWSGWVISPKGYNAYYCGGSCNFPLGPNQYPTNHATVQSIVHALRLTPQVDSPSCVPGKLYSMSLLYFDDDENVILKQYDDMIAANCACR